MNTTRIKTCIETDVNTLCVVEPKLEQEVEETMVGNRCGMENVLRPARTFLKYMSRGVRPRVGPQTGVDLQRPQGR